VATLLQLAAQRSRVGGGCFSALLPLRRLLLDGTTVPPQTSNDDSAPKQPQPEAVLPILAVHQVLPLHVNHALQLT
jgi:hypothetical protein